MNAYAKLVIPVGGGLAQHFASTGKAAPWKPSLAACAPLSDSIERSNVSHWFGQVTFDLHVSRSLSPSQENQRQQVLQPASTLETAAKSCGSWLVYAETLEMKNSRVLNPKKQAAASVARAPAQNPTAFHRIDHSAICSSGSFKRNTRVTPSKQMNPSPIQTKPIMNDMLDKLVHNQMVLRKPKAGAPPYSR